MQIEEPFQPTRLAMGRRRFMRWLMGFSFISTMAIVVTPVIGFLIPPRSAGAGSGGRVLVGTVEDIPLGQGKVVPVGSSPVIVVHTDQGVRAFDGICTHLGCVVAWDGTAANIVCPCHDGRFSAANGSVISGPPPAALPPLTVTVEGKDIYIVSS
jgi:cytochrome b6-f complex iron-sulfur subunit